MVRIEILRTGTLVVIGKDSTRYVDEIDHADIPQKLKDSFKMLRATEPDTELPGRGSRVGQNTYYLYEGEEPDTDNMEFVSMIERRFIRYLGCGPSEATIGALEAILSRAIALAYIDYKVLSKRS